MKKIFVFSLVFLVFVSYSAFGAIKPSLFANFSTGFFQNIDDPYLRQKVGPFRFGEQFGDNRIYLGESAFSALLNLNFKEKGILGNANFYMNKYYHGGVILDVNNLLLGYEDEETSIKGFFKARTFRFKNIPSDNLYDLLPSIDILSATYNRSIIAYPYYAYPLVYADGTIVNLPTLDTDTTNLGLFGKDYYGIYASYYNGFVEVESYFAKNIYGNTLFIATIQNTLSNYLDGNFYGAKVGGAFGLGFGDLHLGGMYRAIVGRSFGYFVGDDYRSGMVFFSAPANYLVLMAGTNHRFEQYAGYLSFIINEFLSFNVDGGIANYYNGQDVFNTPYGALSFIFDGVEGLKLEVVGVGQLASKSNDLNVIGLELKGNGGFLVPLLTEDDTLYFAFKAGARNYKSQDYDSTSVVGLLSATYTLGDFDLSLFGYGNNTSWWSVIQTNVFYGDFRLYVGYDLGSFGKDLKGMKVKVGTATFAQIGFVNEDKQIYPTPYVGFWYDIPKANTLIVLSYGYFGATREFDVDFGRGLESEILLYNGGDTWNNGLGFTDFVSYSTNNIGLYKLSVQPTIRFDLYIKI